MSVVILTPIPLEHKAILKYLNTQSEEIIDGSRYVYGFFEGRHGSIKIATQQTGSGNSTVALATEKAIRHFQPAIIILAGIAGGVKDVVLGDVVVGTKFYGYESGKETESGFVARPEGGFHSKDLIALAQSVAGNEHWKKRVTGGTSEAKVIFGPIASGDKVIADTDGSVFKLLKQSYNDTTAIEMEANGFGQAMLYYPRIPFINIRGISDLLKDKSHADAGGSQERAAANMAAFIFELLYQLDPGQIKIMGMDLKELSKQVLETTLPITKMKADGPDAGRFANSPLLNLWEKMVSILGTEYDALKNAPDDADAKAEARLALRKALEGNATLQAELETLLLKAQKSETGSAVTIKDSKNVIHGSNIHVSGDFRLGDDNVTHHHEDKSKDTIGGDKIVQSGGSIQINNYFGREGSGNPGKPENNSPDGINIQNLQRLIASGRPEAAIQSVLKLTESIDEVVHLEALQISSRWESLARKIRTGIIRNDDATVERSQIVASLLEFISTL